MSRRVAFGNYDAGVIWRIAKPGFDAASETAVGNLSFDMSWLDLTQIVTTGYATPSGSWFSHGFARVKFLANFASLGFIPYVIVCRLRRSPQQFFGGVSVVSDGSISVGYNSAAFTSNQDSGFNDDVAVAWRYIVTKIPCDRAS